ncbi:MAG: creatininase family protein [Gemmatimonadetes bacterium]|nr:creatininase family protein [Gemmatimonadota bacterium]
MRRGNDARRDPSGSEAREGSRLPSYALDQITWKEAAVALRRDPRLIIPAGALEQHGPHLPLGTNTLLAQRVTQDLSESLHVLRAPPIQYGVNVPTSIGFKGSATVRSKTLHRLINDLLESWEEQGVREFIAIVAHRHTPQLDALLMAFTSSASLRVIDLYGIDVADLLQGPAGPQHAGEIETSLMLYLYPERVRTDEISDFPGEPGLLRKYVRGRLSVPPPGWQGALGLPSLASPETGRRIYERFLEILRPALARP